MKSILSILLAFISTFSSFAQITNFTVYVINPTNCPYTFAANWFEQGTFTGGPVNWNSVDTSSTFQDVWSASVPSNTLSDSMEICVVPAPPCSCPMVCLRQSVNPGAYTLQLCVNVGIDEQEQENKFSVFPNPANDKIHLKTNTTLLGSAYIIQDYTGKEVLLGKVLSENIVIDIGNLYSGIYFLKLDESLKKTMKIIKN